MASARSWSIMLSGLTDVKHILRQAGVQSGALAATALWQEGLKIMNVSQRIVPVRWGILRSTGTVNAPTRRGTSIEVVLSYGGPAAPYAWIQHEKMSLRHDAPTSAKYLEAPTLAHASRFEASLANRMQYLFNRNMVLGATWPTGSWSGPEARLSGRGRRSPRRPSR